MRSIGVLRCGGKKKRGAGRGAPFRILACLAFILVLLCAFPAPGGAAQEGSRTLGTQGSGAIIGTDPDTGAKVMKTPEPEPEEEYQGPQSVIVVPEIYPDRPASRPYPRPSPRPQPR